MAFKLKESNDKLCNQLTMAELPYLDVIRKKSNQDVTINY